MCSTYSERRCLLAIKTAAELEKIKKASALNDKCFSHMLDFIKRGMTEIEIAQEIERFLRANGAEGLAFPTIAVSGERGCLIHGEPSDKKIKDGEFLTMDFGPVLDGYCGDMTRTIAIGQPDQEMRKVYDIVLKSQLAGLQTARAGVSAEYVDKVCRGIIDQAGYRDNFPHGTGHGVGREVHEPPWASPSGDRGKPLLLAGETLTVEPGIYIEGRLGVRIEDLAIITDSGIINTNSSPKELLII